MNGSIRLVRNILAMVASQLISWSLTLAVTLFLPRYVGAAGLGRLAFATSFVGIFGVFIPLGTSDVLVREIARKPERTGELLVASMLLRLPLGLLMTGLAVAIAYLLGYPELTRILVIWMALGTVVSWA